MAKRRVSTSRTIRQMMLNESSGVPLVGNAANLKHFFSVRGWASTGWSDEKGDVFLPPWASVDENTVDGNIVRRSGAGIVYSTGSWTPIGASEDYLIVISGYRTPSGGVGENPSLTFRVGGNEAGYGTIRVRAPAVVQNFGDSIQDDAGVTLDTVTTPSIPSRIPPEDGSHYILIGALQRGATDYWHTITWDDSSAYDQNAATDVTAASLGAITPRTREQGAASGIGESTQVGYFCGVGIWVFPNGLPADFRIAALMMGEAWKQGKYTFWPAWGKE